MMGMMGTFVLENRIDFAENRTRGDAGAMNKTPFLGAGIRRQD